MTELRIIVGDDHPLVQTALVNVLTEAAPGMAVTACFTLDEVLAAAAASPADVSLVLLDLNMPGTHGFAGLFLMQSQFPVVPVAIISAQEDAATIRRAMTFGASGFVPKSLPLPDMARAIRAILQGERWHPAHAAASDAAGDADIARRFASLSAQQMRILTRIVDGKLNKQIAGELNVAEQTVKLHVSAIFKKLGVATRTQAAVLAGKLTASPGREDAGKES